jgi:hypothetical protein
MSVLLIILALVLLMALIAFRPWEAPPVPPIEEDPELEPEVLTEVLDTIPATPLPEIEPPKEIVMASFDVAYNIVARHEGGYQKIATDPGNYNSRRELVGTNWGISAPVYESWIGRPPTETDMRQMPKSVARQIFKKNFWDPIQGDFIHSQQLANFLFDGHVNHGRTGIRIMQRVLGVIVDGVFGPVSLMALNGADPKAVFDAYKAARIQFYHELSIRRPEMRNVWLPVWLRRMASFTFTPISGTTALLLVGLITYAITR